ncbi:uncharacterized protein LOC106131069 [Amyelois transitella]|uniref:uncharacterized protein LOC106131069 n=1 Tax=Amyelois transitella TaxID=680683 RepID=UPI00298FDE94|nr:uncharacterized protein LOC106131069 [Amyelois transitella]
MISTNDFDEDDDFEGLYENGHWEWNEQTEGLEFIPDPNLLANDSWMSPPVASIGAADFKDDIDLIEQQRFKKNFQRKTSEDDVVKLQDIKDIVLYTAPPNFITPSVVHLMHLPGTDRFLRTLILYHQYYLQIADEMARRMLEQETKVRTPDSDEIERVYKENLEDLRLLIAKEYSTYVTGSGEFKKFHHMGPSKKLCSLSKKGNIVFETLIRLSIQIVWLALDRKSFNQIELEMHRLFKTEKFNMIEHTLKSNYVAKMSPQERHILFGDCIQRECMMKTQSPLMNEIRCKRIIDWRLLGLGTVKYPYLGPRLQYLQDALILPESNLKKKRVSVGILGLQRSRFDIMLREIPMSFGESSTIMGARTSLARGRSMMASKISRTSRVSQSRKSIASTMFTPEKLITDVSFPSRDAEDEWIPGEFPQVLLPQNHCDSLQRRKWMARANRFARKRSRKTQRKFR